MDLNRDRELKKKQKKTTSLSLNITPVCLGNNVLNVRRKTSKRKKRRRPPRPFISQPRASTLSYFLYIIHFEKHGGRCKDKTACEIYSCAMYTIRVYTFLNYAYMWTIYLCNIQPNKTALTRDAKKKKPRNLWEQNRVTPKENAPRKKIKITGLTQNRNSSFTVRRRVFRHILITTTYSTKMKKKNNDLKRNPRAWEQFRKVEI